MNDLPRPLRHYPRARLVGLVLAWIKSALIVLTMAIGGGGSDPAGQAYLYGGFVLGGLYWLAFLLPALLLLRRDTGRRVGPGFALLILPDVTLALVLAASVL